MKAKKKATNVKKTVRTPTKSEASNVKMDLSKVALVPVHQFDKFCDHSLRILMIPTCSELHRYQPTIQQKTE